MPAAGDAEFDRYLGNVGRNACKRQAESQQIGTTILPPQNGEYDCDNCFVGCRRQFLQGADRQWH